MATCEAAERRPDAVDNPVSLAAELLQLLQHKRLTPIAAAREAARVAP